MKIKSAVQDLPFCFGRHPARVDLARLRNRFDGLDSFRRKADCKSAIQQTASLRYPGGRSGRPGEFRMTNCDFRMGNGTAKYANREGWRFELIRIPWFGRYRKATEGIGRLGNFRMTIFDSRLETDAGSVGISRYWTLKVGIGRLKFFNRRLGYGTTKVIPDGPREFRVGNCDFRMGNGIAKVIPEGVQCAQHAKGGTGWLRFDVGMKGKVVVSSSYRQLTALQKNDFVMEQAGCFDNLLEVSNLKAEGWA